MTTAEALGMVIVAKYDGKPLDSTQRAYVMEAIPPECRFVDDEGRIETCGTILTTLYYLGRPKPVLPAPRQWTEEELDALADER
jgi:hypothetical protein